MSDPHPTTVAEAEPMAAGDDLAIPPVPEPAPIPITPVTGYRQLNQAEIDLMNEGKALASTVGAWISRLEMLPNAPVPDVIAGDLAAKDPRWLAIGRTQLQQGFMAAMRAIARPTTF